VRNEPDRAAARQVASLAIPTSMKPSCARWVLHALKYSMCFVEQRTNEREAVYGVLLDEQITKLYSMDHMMNTTIIMKVDIFMSKKLINTC
jgi:hypothetical protein